MNFTSSILEMLFINHSFVMVESHYPSCIHMVHGKVIDRRSLYAFSPLFRWQVSAEVLLLRSAHYVKR